MAIQKFALRILFSQFAGELIDFASGIEEDENREYWVGTFADHASFVESGTGPHKTAEDQQEFLEDIKEWAKDHGIENVYGLIKSIREEGTDPHPFYRPAVLSVVRRHDGLSADTSSRGRIDITVSEEFTGDVAQIGEQIAKEMRRRVPVHQGDLKRSITHAPTLEQLRKKSLQRMTENNS